MPFWCAYHINYLVTGRQCIFHPKEDIWPCPFNNSDIKTSSSPQQTWSDPKVWASLWIWSIICFLINNQWLLLIFLHYEMMLIYTCSVCTTVILGGNDDLTEESRLDPLWFYFDVLAHVWELFYYLIFLNEQQWW